MGRGRAPCCQKIGLHKGSWTPQEDIRLISYIRKNGHGNWRALPKQAGLLRCGKSCRLRWINYLRPDIKRGNFTKEEEDTIINLHRLLGNKWSKIASCLPGRTDNEIKNVWNTHIKKRLKHESYPTQSPITITARPEADRTSSSSSGTTFTVGEELSLDKIEIPIEPQVDMWDILDSSLSPHMSSLPSPPVENDDILMNIPIDPDLWSDATNIDSRTREVDNGDGDKLVDDSKDWLAYLEEELGLFDETEAEEKVGLTRMQEGDSMGSYFHRLPTSSFSSSSSSPPSLTKLVDLNCINA